jgi:hypothetical protein
MSHFLRLPLHSIHGSSIAISILINFISVELANVLRNEVREHQKKVEQNYLENNIFFNLRATGK